MTIEEMPKNQFIQKFNTEDFMIFTINDPFCDTAECHLVIPLDVARSTIIKNIQNSLIELYQAKQSRKQTDCFQTYLKNKPSDNIYYTETRLFSDTNKLAYIGINEPVTPTNVMTFWKKFNQWSKEVEN